MSFATFHDSLCPHCGFRDARFWHWEEQLPRGKRFYLASVVDGFVGEDHGFERSLDYMRIGHERSSRRKYLRYYDLLFILKEDGTLCSAS